MPRKKHHDEDDAENFNNGSGEFTGKLLDNLDNLDKDEDDDNNLSDFDFDDDSSHEERSPLDLIEDKEEIKEKKTRKVNLNSKLIGKHSLKYDTIFKGKKEDAVVEDDTFTEHIIKNAGGSLDIDDSDIGNEESKSSIDAYRDSELKKHIYSILEENTDIKFSSHMRKPAKTDFNAYFALLIKELAQYGYTNTEIFIELSGYFSPNVWNMFQLLDKHFSNLIIYEMKEKHGISGINKINFLS